jgi:uracil-DNA glycosylase family 4
MSLRDRIRACEACALRDGCAGPVPGYGPLDAEIMLVGEAPGASEDRKGIPFTGQAGSVLDDALERARIDRHECFITNTVRCRPTANRTPTEAEARFCGDLWLTQEITMVQPHLIVAMGQTALRYLTDHPGAVMDHYHGQILERDVIQ